MSSATNHPSFSNQIKSVPCALKRKAEEELDRLVQTKVIEPVRYFDWATPIVPVPKADGKVRVYKLTVNRVSIFEQYPIHPLRKNYRRETIHETGFEPRLFATSTG